MSSGTHIAPSPTDLPRATKLGHKSGTGHQLCYTVTTPPHLHRMLESDPWGPGGAASLPGQGDERRMRWQVLCTVVHGTCNDPYGPVRVCCPPVQLVI